MEYAFSYTSKTSKGVSVQGVVFAENFDDAFFKVKSILKLSADRIQFNAFETLLGWLSPNPSGRDLIRFYRTVGERKRLGKSIPAGLLDAMEYVENKRFVSSIAIMRQGMMDGIKLSDAMEMGAFPMADIAAVRSVHSAGKEGDILLSLADQIEMNEEIRRKIASIIWYPTLVATVGWVVIWGILMFVAPRLGDFFKKIAAFDLGIPEWTRKYYQFAEYFSSHAVVSTTLWFLVPVGVLYLVRSQSVRALLDKVPAFHNLSMKSDLISIWSSVALLHMAGVKPAELYASVVGAAKREDNKDRLRQMADIYRKGNNNFVTAVTQCNFPRYVIAEISAASSGSGWTEGFKSLIALMRQDVIRHVEQTQRIVSILSYIMIAFMLLGFFAVTLYPQMAATYSRL